MAGGLIPTAKRFFICDDVVGNPATGKPMIVNLWDTVRVPVGQSFPFRLNKVCLFAWLRGGRGEVTFRFELVRQTDRRVVTAPWVQRVTFADPNRTIYARFLLPNVSFPEPGVYTVDVFCNDEFFDDQVVTVLAAE